MTGHIVQFGQRPSNRLDGATPSEALIGSATWLEALIPILENEASEFALDDQFVELLLSQEQHQAMLAGLKRVAEILRKIDADVCPRGGAS